MNHHLSPISIAASILDTPWRLFRQEETIPVFREGPARALFFDLALKVWEEAVDMCRTKPNQMSDPSIPARALLMRRIFAYDADHRNEALRAAFEECLDPLYRAGFMAQATSNFIWVDVRCQFATEAALNNTPGAEAMVSMLDLLKEEAQDLRMGMSGDGPSVLWEDLLLAVDAPHGPKATLLLSEFAKDGYVTMIDDQPFLLLDSFVWTIAKMVVELSRTPHQKRHLVDAGYRVFSATLRSRPEDVDILSDVLKDEIQEIGLGAVQSIDAETRQAFAIDGLCGEPLFSVTEDLDGVVGVERHKRVVH